MGFLRSEEMGYYSIVIPNDQAWEVLNQLGKLSAVQFVDQNSDQAVFNRRYASYIRRCEEAERRLRFLAQEQERFKVQVMFPKDSNLVLDMIDGDLRINKIPAQTHFETMENDLQNYEDSMILQLKNYEQLTTGMEFLKEKRVVLSKAREAFNIEGQLGGSLFSRIAGIIENEDITRFKRMVFRITRGNALSVFSAVKDEEEDAKKKVIHQKSVFFIMYQGDQSGNISTRLGRICDTIGIRRYALPNDAGSLDEEWRHNEDEIVANADILEKTKQAIINLLRKLATPRGESPCSLIEELRLFILKEKSIYHSLNMFSLKGNMFYGSCWCPKSDEQRILHALSAGFLKEIEGGFPHNQKPPTYFRLNDFTQPFQNIVDTYGIPAYQEANPAFFSAVTFPFLFGIMFGDVGHGLVLTIFATYLCWAEKSIMQSGGLFKPAVPVRYLLLMMGLCATYSGFIYNDFLGIPFNFFGTRWNNKNIEYDQYYQDSTYPFGFDPVWYRSKNELIFFNSFKMKLSVVFGVIQMICGNFFKGANAIHFKSKINFFFEFIPQLVFMCAIFGYMIIMVFIKWCSSWNYNFGDRAPNLITVLMNMFLKLGKLDDDKDRTLWGDKEGQEQLQLILLIVAVLCVPIMLFPKPIIMSHMHKKQQHGGKDAGYEEFDEESHGHKDESFGELFIHQMIETIEYVLGAVSNTASYLRLWALSLAHAQLSSVFFEKALVSTIEMGNPVAVVIGFFLFANISVGVLMCMDSLECFLHALRLHWVEFMNKFYKGDGIKFQPFSFDLVIKAYEAKKQ